MRRRESLTTSCLFKHFPSGSIRHNTSQVWTKHSFPTKFGAVASWDDIGCLPLYCYVTSQGDETSLYVKLFHFFSPEHQYEAGLQAGICSFHSSYLPLTDESKGNLFSGKPDAYLWKSALVTRGSRDSWWGQPPLFFL